MVAESPPAFLTALGRGKPPDTIEVGPDSYTLARVFKNDFFAITCLYHGQAGKVVLKINRQAPLVGVPLGWIGCLLAAREEALYHRVEGIEGVPRFLGRWGAAGVVHEFIPGHPLERRECVPDDFHPRLRRIIEYMHRRQVAYVDLEKCQNVLVGDDRRPYLMDFQISWYWPRRWGGQLWPARLIRRRLQTGDLYHLVKLQRRTRPDQLTPEALAASYHRPSYMRLYGFLTRPVTLLRRAILTRLDLKRGEGERGRVDRDGTGRSDPVVDSKL